MRELVDGTIMWERLEWHRHSVPRGPAGTSPDLRRRQHLVDDVCIEDRKVTGFSLPLRCTECGREATP